ncbi:MAG: MFS transporter, partial [Pirellulaceae bacterium]
NWSMAVTTIGQAAEIVTMVILGRVLTKLGWRTTMVIGILGHAIRFGTFALFGSENWQWLIIFVQILHGICYAFFFATLYIFVDSVFPKDIRTSAQGMFNLLILGAGLVIANFWFISIKDQYTIDGVVAYNKVFLYPTGLAFLGALMLLFLFKPPSERPEPSEVPKIEIPHEE